MPLRSIAPLSRHRAILLVLTAFVVAGLALARSAQGDDLASSYVGCRLVAHHRADHLYSFDPDNFAAVGPDEPGNPWQAEADDGQFDGFLHPYVQTPLWAFALQPLCTRVEFPIFAALFAGLTMLSFAAFLWLIVRFWAPDLYHPFAFALLCLVLWYSQPFRYATMLLQTHILLMLPAVAALILAQRSRPVLAGLLLAFAAAVKVTPAVLILYWLLTRRFKAAGAMVLWSAVFAALTLLATGPHVMAAYLADLHRISAILLISQNNQSFAAWAMGLVYPRAEIARFQMLPLPPAMRLASSALMIAVTAAGGLLDRDLDHQPTWLGRPRAPLGAAMALIAATVFAPIAWTHYAFILLVPVVMLAQENRRLRSRSLSTVLLAVAALNLRPLSTDVQQMVIGRFSIVRAQFFASILCLLALAMVAWTHRAALQRLSPLDAPDRIAESKSESEGQAA